ncbi:MAG: hypothetical protein IMZ71_02590 [Chloroflexi bacterium]|nr:hypothetical protein [Chloroflexota bacterium]
MNKNRDRNSTDQDWLIKRIADGMVQEDAQQFALLLGKLEREHERERNAQYEASLNAAMLADLAELSFGRSINGAPSLMSYAHAGWACGPVSKPGKSYVRWMLTQWHKDDLAKETIGKIEEWETYLESKETK